jgi:hypothetical protein
MRRVIQTFAASQKQPHAHDMRHEVPPCSYDFAGDRFGTLVAIRWAGCDNNPFERHSLWRFICEATRETALHRVKLRGQP